MKKMAAPGHYKRPVLKMPGMSSMNAPRPGRVGKMVPPMKKLGVPGLKMPKPSDWRKARGNGP